MKNLILVFAGAAMAVSGCAHPTEQNRFDYEVSQGICSVDALAEEKQTSLNVMNESKRSIAAYQNKTGAYEEDTYTILQEKLYRYEAELEAAYRFATQNCGAYMRCLERNKHDEWSCQRTEERWAASQQRFADLIVDIRNIAADVDIAAIQASRRGRKPGRNDRGRLCGTTNSVFTDRSN